MALLARATPRVRGNCLPGTPSSGDSRRATISPILASSGPVARPTDEPGDVEETRMMSHEEMDRLIEAHLAAEKAGDTAGCGHVHRGCRTRCRRRAARPAPRQTGRAGLLRAPHSRHRNRGDGPGPQLLRGGF